MNIIRPGFVPYAFTIKCNTGDKEADYTPFFKKCERFKIEIGCKYKEYGKCKVAHYHGILFLKEGFFRKKLTTKGFCLKLVEVWYENGWMDYIQKEQKNIKSDDVKVAEVYDEISMQRDIEFDYEDEFIDEPEYLKWPKMF